MEREIEYPKGTRHKDRDEIERRLAALEDSGIEVEEIVDLVEYALASGARKVPGWVGSWG